MARHVINDPPGGGDLHRLRRGRHDAGPRAQVEGLPLRHRAHPHAHAQRHPAGRKRGRD